MKKSFFIFLLICILSSFGFSYDLSKGKKLKSYTVMVTTEMVEKEKKPFETLIDYWIAVGVANFGAENILDIKMNMHLMGMVITFIYQE